MVIQKIIETVLNKRAEKLYAAYCKSVGGKAFDGKPLPAWDEFRNDPTKQKQSDAWIAVAKESF